jgi:hypothetical protein
MLTVYTFPKLLSSICDTKMWINKPKIKHVYKNMTILSQSIDDY